MHVPLSPSMPCEIVRADWDGVTVHMEALRLFMVVVRFSGSSCLIGFLLLAMSHGGPRPAAGKESKQHGTAH